MIGRRQSNSTCECGARTVFCLRRRDSSVASLLSGRREHRRYVNRCEITRWRHGRHDGGSRYCAATEIASRAGLPMRSLVCNPAMNAGTAIIGITPQRLKKISRCQVDNHHRQVFRKRHGGTSSRNRWRKTTTGLADQAPRTVRRLIRANLVEIVTSPRDRGTSHRRHRRTVHYVNDDGLIHRGEEPAGRHDERQPSKRLTLTTGAAPRWLPDARPPASSR